METIELKIQIAAPQTRVFDIARSIDAHMATQTRHQERAVAGRTQGLIELGEEVTWEAVHFGLRQRLSSKIVAFEYPAYFRDSMVKGAFAGFDHDHYFETLPSGLALMRDRFVFTAPWGPLGWLAERLFLKTYMTRLLKERSLIVKAICESERWQEFLPLTEP